MDLKYKSYWRKSGLKGKWGDIYLKILNKYKPKNFLEIGVFCGVTSRNTCDYLNNIHKNNFSFIGIDLFGLGKETGTNEIEPEFLKDQKFSNPLKNFYYNIILKEKLNSIKSVSKLLNKYKNNVKLVQGDTNKILNTLDLKEVDFAFIDGGHSYKTVISDLNTIYENIKGKNKVLLCDDYGNQSYISEVKKAIDDFVKNKNLKLNVIEERFAEIIT